MLLAIIAGVAFLFSFNNSSQDLELLRLRIAANGGSTSMHPTRFSSILESLMRLALGGFNSRLSPSFENYTLHIPDGFQFTDDEFRTLSRNHRVIGLEFARGTSDLQLTRLQGLKHLQTLIIERERLSPENIDEISKFTILRAIGFRKCEVQQDLVNAIDSLKNLQYIYFYDCRFDPSLKTSNTKSSKLLMVGVDQNGYPLRGSRDWLSCIPSKLRSPPATPTPTPGP